MFIEKSHSYARITLIKHTTEFWIPDVRRVVKQLANNEEYGEKKKKIKRKKKIFWQLSHIK